jgi:hypothetical protein
MKQRVRLVEMILAAVTAVGRTHQDFHQFRCMLQ